MNKYSVFLMARAYKDLDEIYLYISNELKVKETALEIVDEIEKLILSLDLFPYRGSERKVGKYANKGYHQLFVKNYVVVYRIVEENKEVIVLTIRYTPSNF